MLEQPEENIQALRTVGLNAEINSLGTNLGKIQEYLDLGMDINQSEPGDEGMSPLVTAAYMGKTDVAKMLIERGADANLAASNRFTPVMMAARQGCVDVMLLLLDHGAAINAKSPSGCTALRMAAWNKRENAIVALVNRGADILTTNAISNKNTIDICREMDLPLIAAFLERHVLKNTVTNTVDVADPSQVAPRTRSRL